MKDPMVRSIKFSMTFLRDERGAAAAEYGMLIAALVILVALAAATLGDTLSEVLGDAADCVEVGCV